MTWNVPTTPAIERLTHRTAQAHARDICAVSQRVSCADSSISRPPTDALIVSSVVLTITSAGGCERDYATSQVHLPPRETRWKRPDEGWRSVRKGKKLTSVGRPGVGS